MPNRKRRQKKLSYTKLEPRRVLSVNTTLVGGVLDIDITSGGSVEANLTADPNDASQFFIDENANGTLDGGEFTDSISSIESINVRGSKSNGDSLGTFRWIGNFSQAPLDQPVGDITLSATNLNHISLAANADINGDVRLSAENLVKLGGNLDIDGDLNVRAQGKINDANNTELNVTGNARFTATDEINLADKDDALTVEGHARFVTETRDSIFAGVNSQLEKSEATVNFGTVSFDTSIGGDPNSAARVAIATDSDLHLTQVSVASRVNLITNSNLTISANLSSIDLQTSSAGETLVDANILSDQAHFESQSQLTLDSTVTANELFLQSDSGVTQSSGSIDSDSLMLAGSGDFSLQQNNEIGNATSAGELAASVDGSIAFRNQFAINAASESIDGTSTRGITVLNESGSGDLSINLQNANLSQLSNASITVAGETQLQTGTGFIDLIANQNDFDSISIQSALTAEIVDRNDLTIERVTTTESAYVQAGSISSGKLTIQNSVTATDQILLRATNGIDQNVGSILTSSLLVDGSGDFSLNRNNQIDSLAANVDGTLTVNSMSDLVAADLTYDRINEPNVRITGISGQTLDNLTLRSSGTISFDQKVDANSICVHSEAGFSQSQSGKIFTDALALSGTGDFIVDNISQWGTSGQPGTLAAEINGSLKIDSNFSITIGQVDCGPALPVLTGVSIANGPSTANASGDLTINLVNRSLTQEANASVFVANDTSLSVGKSRIDLTGGDSDSNGTTNNNFNTLAVDSSRRTEIADRNDLQLHAINAEETIFIDTQGHMVLNDSLIAEDTIFLQSQQGVTQSDGTLETNELMLRGNGDFILGSENRIGSSTNPARLAADIDGSLQLQNRFDSNISRLDFAHQDTTTDIITGVNISQNFQFDSAGGDLTQDSNAPIIVGNEVTFNLVNGNIELRKGDADSDSLNDNDLNFFDVQSASIVEIGDSNSLNTQSLFISDRASFSVGESSAATLNMLGDANIGNHLQIHSTDGVEQIGGRINTNQLQLTGDGNFDLQNENRIGDETTTGKLAVDIAGNLSLNNLFALEVSERTYNFQDTTNLTTNGITIAESSLPSNLNGDFDIQLNDSDFTQRSNTPIIVEGNSTFDIGQGCIELNHPSNELNQLAIDSAKSVEITNRDSINLQNINITDDFRLQTLNGSIVLSDIIMVGDQVQFRTTNGVQQTAGTLIASSLQLFGSGDFELAQANQIGAASKAGEFAANIDGRLDFTNITPVNVTTIDFARKSGRIESASGIDGSISDARVDADGITILESIDADKVFLTSNDGATQTSSGIITAEDLIVTGQGIFDLSQANQIGNSSIAGDLSADITGRFTLFNEHQINITTLSFEDTTVSGAQIDSDSDSQSGLFRLITTHDGITQSADAPIVNSTGDVLNRFEVQTANIILRNPQNDFDQIQIDSATSASFMDLDDITFRQVNLNETSGTLFAETTDGPVSQFGETKIIAQNIGVIASGQRGAILLPNVESQQVSTLADGKVTDTLLPINQNLVAAGEDELLFANPQNREFGTFIRNHKELLIGEVSDPLGSRSLSGISAADGHVYLETLDGDLTFTHDVLAANPEFSVTGIAAEQLNLAGGNLLRGGTGREDADGLVSTLPLTGTVVDPVPPGRIENFVVLLVERLQRVTVQFAAQNERDFNARITWADGEVDRYFTDLESANPETGVTEITLTKKTPFTFDFLIFNQELPATLELFNDSRINIFENGGRQSLNTLNQLNLDFLGVVSFDEGPAVMLPRETPVEIDKPPTSDSRPIESSTAISSQSEFGQAAVVITEENTELISVRIFENKIVDQQEWPNFDSENKFEIEKQIIADGEYLPGIYQLRRISSEGTTEVVHEFEKQLDLGDLELDIDSDDDVPNVEGLQDKPQSNDSDSLKDQPENPNEELPSENRSTSNEQASQTEPIEATIDDGSNAESNGESNQLNTTTFAALLAATAAIRQKRSKTESIDQKHTQQTLERVKQMNQAINRIQS